MAVVMVAVLVERKETHLVVLMAVKMVDVLELKLGK